MRYSQLNFELKFQHSKTGFSLFFTFFTFCKLYFIAGAIESFQFYFDLSSNEMLIRYHIPPFTATKSVKLLLNDVITLTLRSPVLWRGLSRYTITYKSFFLLLLTHFSCLFFFIFVPIVFTFGMHFWYAFLL